MNRFVRPSYAVSTDSPAGLPSFARVPQQDGAWGALAGMPPVTNRTSDPPSGGPVTIKLRFAKPEQFRQGDFIFRDNGNELRLKTRMKHADGKTLESIPIDTTTFPIVLKESRETKTVADLVKQYTPLGIHMGDAFADSASIVVAGRASMARDLTGVPTEHGSYVYLIAHEQLDPACWEDPANNIKSEEDARDRIQRMDTEAGNIIKKYIRLVITPYVWHCRPQDYKWLHRAYAPFPWSQVWIWSVGKVGMAAPRATVSSMRLPYQTTYYNSIDGVTLPTARYVYPETQMQLYLDYQHKGWQRIIN